MTEFAEYESLLAQRFAGLKTSDDGDWLDVRRRARRMRVRSAALVAAAIITANLVVAPAFGLHRIVVDWLEAEPAPARTQLQFSQLGVGAPNGMDPRVVPNSARKVTEFEHAGEVAVLWVAPTEGGGFCVLWTALFGGGCLPTRDLPDVKPANAGDFNPFLLGLSYGSDPQDRGMVRDLSGYLLAPETERVLLSFADGAEAEVPVVWVSPPIDAGFYAYVVPDEHTQAGRHVSAVTAVDGDGRVLARQTFALTRPQDVQETVLLPDGVTATLPQKAIVERARKLIDFQSENGMTTITLWVMPSTDGGRCFAYSRSSGCLSSAAEAHPLGAGVHGGSRPVLIGGQVRSDVATYELRYEDGAIERLRPVEGFILHEISERHYPRGHRLNLVRALDHRGRELARLPVRADAPGVYPCEKPIEIGHGVMSCP